LGDTFIRGGIFRQNKEMGLNQFLTFFLHLMDKQPACPDGIEQ
jgi:hypothetical protein